MKKVLAVLLLTVLLVSLCACAKTPNQPTTKPSCEHQYTEKVTKAATCAEEGEKTFTCTKCKDTYTEPIEMRTHTYLDASCTDAKTCVNCGKTQGRAKGHNYIQGVCTYCKEEQPGYVSLTGNNWQTIGRTFSKEEVDVIQLRFTEEGCYVNADVWALLSKLSPEKQEQYLKNPEGLIEFKREKYYPMGFSDTCSFKFEEEENIATITCINGNAVGIIVMERKDVDKYTVTEISGIIINDIVTSCIEVGSNFTAVK